MRILQPLSIMDIDTYYIKGIIEVASPTTPTVRVIKTTTLNLTEYDERRSDR